jgi:hypothetical protein
MLREFRIVVRGIIGAVMGASAFQTGEGGASNQ